ncbi:hypothetical protein L3Y34_011448 [Caenorhabditis briggsae]|uniref:Uncharacterized protein n=1 Tax=Caenorhabditis briggsae TaxID=6238 RepID=A0AAE8ZPX8_CAEBR|nr:hypothetical protein L3Y34_011448 [Caenorhabditis briggsae]
MEKNRAGIVKTSNASAKSRTKQKLEIALLELEVYKQKTRIGRMKMIMKYLEKSFSPGEDVLDTNELSRCVRPTRIAMDDHSPETSRILGTKPLTQLRNRREQCCRLDVVK